MRVGDEPSRHGAAENENGESKEESFEGDVKYQQLDLRHTLDASEHRHTTSSSSSRSSSRLLMWWEVWTVQGDTNTALEMTEEELEELEMAEAAAKAQGDHSGAVAQSLLLPPVPVKQTGYSAYADTKEKQNHESLAKS